MLELASLFRQNLMVTDVVLEAKSQQLVQAAAHLVRVVTVEPSSLAGAAGGEDQSEALPSTRAPSGETTALVSAQLSQQQAPPATQGTTSSGRAEGRSPPVPSLRLASLSSTPTEYAVAGSVLGHTLPSSSDQPCVPTSVRDPTPLVQEIQLTHSLCSLCVCACMGWCRAVSNCSRCGDVISEGSRSSMPHHCESLRNFFGTWPNTLSTARTLPVLGASSSPLSDSVVISHAKEVAERPDTVQRRAQIVQDCQLLATTGAEWIRCGASTTASSCPPSQTPPKTPRTEGRIKNRYARLLHRHHRS
jgi:dihydroxyacetone kinase DhaKLM complex PTS-EIIA-like component DhaM